MPLAHGVQVMSLVAVPAAAKYVPTGQLVDQAVQEVFEFEADVKPVAHAAQAALAVAVHAPTYWPAAHVRPVEHDVQAAVCVPAAE